MLFIFRLLCVSETDRQWGQTDSEDRQTDSEDSVFLWSCFLRGVLSVSFSSLIQSCKAAVCRHQSQSRLCTSCRPLIGRNDPWMARRACTHTHTHSCDPSASVFCHQQPQCWPGSTHAAVTPSPPPSPSPSLSLCPSLKPYKELIWQTKYYCCGKWNNRKREVK